jgi:hypothetical protein
LSISWPIFREGVTYKEGEGMQNIHFVTRLRLALMFITLILGFAVPQLAGA